jgi:nitrogen PTS system EIIA component
MTHALKIATDTGLAMLWPFGQSQAATATPPDRRIFLRRCPICGFETSQRIIERGRGYLTYWCSECIIPHDVEQAAAIPGALDARGGASEHMAGGQMEISELLQPQSVLVGVRVSSKKEALSMLAHQAASRTGQPERVILDALVERERLGSTGIGSGIAVPHARLPGLDGLCAVFLRLDRPIDFEAVDDWPVDLIFLLLSPETAGADHLRALSRISRLLRDGKVCQALRRTPSPTDLHLFLSGRLGSA